MSLQPEHLSQQASLIEFGPIKKDIDQSKREVFFITIVCHPSQLEQAKQRLFAEHHCYEQTFIEWQYITSESVISDNLTEYRIQGSRSTIQ